VGVPEALFLAAVMDHFTSGPAWFTDAADEATGQDEATTRARTAQIVAEIKDLLDHPHRPAVARMAENCKPIFDERRQACVLKMRGHARDGPLKPT